MSRHARFLSVGNANTQHLSMGVLALCFPVPKLQAIVEQCGRASQRVRDLPAVVVVFYVIALSLFPGTGYESVLRWLLSGLQWLGAGSFRISGKGALSAARQRLGAEPMREVHRQLAVPLANPALKGCFWKQLHVVALDGSTMALQDTAANHAAFGRSSNQNGPAAYPLARFVALVETGTHLIFGAQLGKYRDSELRLAQDVLGKLKPGMLCLADRLFACHPLWQQAAGTGAHLLWRAKAMLHLRRTKELADGSWLGSWHRPKGGKEGSQSHGVVRVIEYRVRKPGAPSQGASEQRYRLLTTILDPAVASARELAEFYPQRWEMELSIKEGKSILRHGQLTLRSKVPELVHQEFWGLLLAHYLVRKMMAQASLEQYLDPDEISYQGSVEIIKSTQAGPVLAFSP
jgi:Insertion element 4 transposase N-terminal/Transposase DDE domain